MVQEDLKKIVIILGPTAAGKTAIGIALAKRFEGEIVNADSGQVWKGLDIGTAKPDAATRAQIPHHLFDVTDPGEHFDASLYVKLADQAIQSIIAKGKNPFVVGGTGMYIRMLVHGFCGAPPRSPQLRDELAREIEVLGLGALYARLAQIDPATAGVVHSNDRTRIVRALEIFESTGITASEFYRLHRFEELRYKALKIGLDIPRDELYARIDERVDKMMKEGWLREVENLKSRYGSEAQAFSAIGYRELLQHVSGEIVLDEAVNLIKRNSRRFAKRQLTWFRADHEIKWHTSSQISAIESEIDTFLHSV